MRRNKDTGCCVYWVFYLREKHLHPPPQAPALPHVPSELWLLSSGRAQISGSLDLLSGSWASPHHVPPGSLDLGFPPELLTLLAAWAWESSVVRVKALLQPLSHTPPMGQPLAPEGRGEKGQMCRKLFPSSLPDSASFFPGTLLKCYLLGSSLGLSREGPFSGFPQHFA